MSLLPAGAPILGTPWKSACTLDGPNNNKGRRWNASGVSETERKHNWDLGMREACGQERDGRPFSVQLVGSSVTAAPSACGRRELFKPVVVSPWFQADVRLGSLALILDPATCFSAEIYATEVGLSSHTEETKLNFGGQVISGVFAAWALRKGLGVSERARSRVLSPCPDTSRLTVVAARSREAQGVLGRTCLAGSAMSTSPRASASAVVFLERRCRHLRGRGALWRFCRRKYSEGSSTSSAGAPQKRRPSWRAPGRATARMRPAAGAGDAGGTSRMLSGTSRRAGARRRSPEGDPPLRTRWGRAQL